MRTLEFIYYRLYRTLLKTTAKDVAEYVACIWFAVLLGVNIIVIIGNLGINPLKQMYPKVYGLLILLPLFILFYFLFLRGKRYLQRVERYKDETKKQHMKGKLILIAYVVASFAALIFL